VHFATLHPKRLVAEFAKVGARRSGLAMTGLLGLAVLGAQLGLVASAEAHPASFLQYQRGYYLDKWSGRTWLCHGWANGAYHCTQHWHRNANGHLISDNSRWVPNSLGTRTLGATHPAAVAHTAAVHTAATHRAITRKAAPPKRIIRHTVRHAAPAARYSGGSVQNQIRAVFGPYAGRALRIAACESGFNPSAASRISTAKGVFQFLNGTWATTSYRNYSPFNAWANIRAAYEVFTRDGHSWREWQCNSMV
jgi:hypothetical protein